MTESATFHDIDAEKAVLGAMLTSRRACDDVTLVLATGDAFHQPRHELIYDAIVHLYSRGQPADTITVADHLAVSGNLARAGDRAYLAELALHPGAAIPENTGYYADIVKGHADRRQVDRTGLQLRELAKRGINNPVEEVLAEARALLDRIHGGHAQDDAATRAKRMLPRLDWYALWADDTPEEWVHEPLLGVGRNVAVFSAPKVGKSLLMLEFAVAISRAEPFLDFTTHKRWRVLYVDLENDPRGDIRSRLQDMGYGPDDLDHVDYLSFPSMAALDSERGGLELMEAVKAYGSEVVIIDTVSRVVDGEENSNDTWLAFYRHTGIKLKRAGVSMIRLDHTGKDEAKGTRGGSAKSGDVDAIWKLSTVVRDSRYRLECTESRMMIDTKSMTLLRERIPRLRHRVEGSAGVTTMTPRSSTW